MPAPAPAQPVRRILAADVLHLIAAGAWLGALPALHPAARHGPARADRRLEHGCRRRCPSLFPARHRLRRNFTGDGAGQCVGLAVRSARPDRHRIWSAARAQARSVRRHDRLCRGQSIDLTPQLPRPTALRALERNSLAELALGLGVLLFVAALGTMAPPVHDHVHLPTGPIDPQAAYVHIHSEPAMADVSITPGGWTRARDNSPVTRRFYAFHGEGGHASAHAAGTARRCIDIEQRHSPARRSWTVDRLAIGAPGISVWVSPSRPRLARRSSSMRRS